MFQESAYSPGTSSSTSSEGEPYVYDYDNGENVDNSDGEDYADVWREPGSWPEDQDEDFEGLDTFYLSELSFRIENHEAEDLLEKPLLENRVPIVTCRTVAHRVLDRIQGGALVQLPAEVKDLIIENLEVPLSASDTYLEVRAIWSHPKKIWTYKSNLFAHREGEGRVFVRGVLGNPCSLPKSVNPAPRLSRFDEPFPLLNYNRGILKFEYLRCGSCNKDWKEYEMAMKKACRLVSRFNKKEQYFPIKRLQLSLCPSDTDPAVFLEKLEEAGVQFVTLQYHDHWKIDTWKDHEERDNAKARSVRDISLMDVARRRIVEKGRFDDYFRVSILDPGQPKEKYFDKGPEENAEGEAGGDCEGDSEGDSNEDFDEESEVEAEAEAEGDSDGGPEEESNENSD